MSGRDSNVLCDVRDSLVRPPEEVWAFLVDLPETPRWRSHLRSVGWIDDGDIRDGRRSAVESSFAGWRKVAMQGEVTVYEPLERFSCRITDGPLICGRTSTRFAQTVRVAQSSR